ncbi:hypothetical protein H2198_002420 [Neophaeococcomyces mojaviensis]|uniref:Uncharacterized protein n=1 Tax=Neophaeococcomyces mojaviensis TaxID=3383035 RepID=A0ACC3AFA7_9EURO|nr:hypothetical protein H2198_002420 [Knufia sp. JES_112]
MTSTKDNSSYTLIYHPFSPFARKVFMYAIELGISELFTLRKVVVAPVHYPGWSDDVPFVGAFNPLAKIPTLAIGQDDGFFGSATICAYVSALARQRGINVVGDESAAVDRVFWRRRTIEACVDGMLDAEILVAYEQRIRKEKGLYMDSWVEGQRQKVQRGISRLEQECQRGSLKVLGAHERADIADCAVAVVLGFLDIREVEWRSTAPGLDSWYESVKQRPSFLQTNPLADWTGKPEEKNRL